ncbi:aquaporin-5-like isoform X1 [Phaenicophaeus curvirostris]|uniref:aquaporin-5-like isoform X1 n=1 Tax=Phaenicophaeus curvirostris TaxID=33595 RepID=UPI0037F0D0F8
MALGEELRSGCFWRGVLAEATATLLFVGTVLGASVAPTPLAPALAGGLVAGGLAGSLGGPQANPALTLALLCTRKLGLLRGTTGILAQCAGAVLASAAARLALPDGASLVTRVTAMGTAGQALAWETFATFQLALAAFATTGRASPPAGLALGSAVAAGALAAVRNPPTPGGIPPSRLALSPCPTGAAFGGQHEPRTIAGAGRCHRHLGRPLGVLAGPGAGRGAGRALLRVHLRTRCLPGEAGCLPRLPGRGAGGDHQPGPLLTPCPQPPCPTSRAGPGHHLSPPAPILGP